MDEAAGIKWLDTAEQEPGQLFFSRFFLCYWAPENAGHELFRLPDGASHALLAALAVAIDSAGGAADEVTEGSDGLASEESEMGFQSDMLRDLVGNPFRPVRSDPEWWTSNVLAIAQRRCADQPNMWH